MFTTTQLSAEEARWLLSLPRLPGRLTAGEAAVLLGFSTIDIPVLVAKRHLKPLGRPSSNATKYFASTQIIQHATDPAWLDRATMALANHWREKNQRKHSRTTA